MTQQTVISDEKTLNKVYTAKTSEELMDAYKDWAADYDKDTVGAFGYVAHIATAAALDKTLSDQMDRESVYVLDAGCGTGLVGEELKRRGYARMDALDYSREMLEEAEAKKIYSDHFQADMSRPLELETNRYDAVVCTGTFTYGHVKPDAFDELVRITRPEGLICFTIREGAYEDYGYRDRMISLEQKQAWKLVEMYDTDYLKEENITCKMCIYKVLA